jgi:hypothetical protein
MPNLISGKHGLRRPAVVLGGTMLLVLAGTAAVRAEEPNVVRNVETFAPVKAEVLNVDLRNLPKARQWEPGDPIKEIPRRSTKIPAPVPEPQPMEDALRAVPASKSIDAIGAPLLNFNGGGFTGVNPPDTVGDIGLNHYIQAINTGAGGGGGTQLRIYDRTGALVAGPIVLDTLGATAPCNNGLGDPVVNWDQFAQRWVLSEFSATGNRMCVYVSQTTDPVAGGWFAYSFQGTSFPDYPKYGVWPDAYYVGTNEATAAAYAFGPRAAMLAGAPASQQRFSVTPPLNFGFEGIQPADADGALPPPAGAPGTFWRHRDSESHGSPGGPDTVQYYEFHVDFAVPGNSTFTGPINITVTEFDSNLCGLVSFNCFPQPSGPTLDPLREPVMHRAQYRNRGTHEVVVGSFVTDVTGGDVGGVRWFEVRKVGPAAFTLFQEGTISPDNTNRWMSSAAMDGSGNIAVAYNVTSTSVFPGQRYTGRVSTDPPGTMAAEQVIVAGTAANGSNRYGDYSSLNVDPVDECTFWWTGEYNPAGQWSTRIATFKFPVPECIPVPVTLGGFTVE